MTVTYFADGFTNVKVTVHDLAGSLVNTLVDEVPAAGSHSAYWRGRDSRGEEVAAGAYVCRYESADEIYSRILLYLR